MMFAVKRLFFFLKSNANGTRLSNDRYIIFFLKAFNSFMFYIYIYIYIYRDTICNDPHMIIGSYVKGPNNMICRAWV